MFKNKAFISYRHVPHDAEVASVVQRNLEQFRIPKGIRAAGRKRQLGRIFRDKTDLGTQTDLTEELQRELDDSEFLIVICSPEASASRWVPEEISYFLLHHGSDKILPVLAAGDPEPVYEALFRSASGAPKEPVACDFRGDIRQAVNEELPRLVCTLIGCTYDELVNRTRRREKKHTMIVASVAAAAAVLISGISVWFGFTGMQIKKELREVKLENSRLRAKLPSEEVSESSLFTDHFMLRAVGHGLEAIDLGTGTRAWLTEKPEYDSMKPVGYADGTIVVWAAGQGKDDLLLLEQESGIPGVVIPAAEVAKKVHPEGFEQAETSFGMPEDQRETKLSPDGEYLFLRGEVEDGDRRSELICAINTETMEAVVPVIGQEIPEYCICDGRVVAAVYEGPAQEKPGDGAGSRDDELPGEGKLVLCAVDYRTGILWWEAEPGDYEDGSLSGAIERAPLDQYFAISNSDGETVFGDALSGGLTEKDRKIQDSKE